MKILHVVGARPNFMKVAPIMAEMAKYPDRFEQVLVHTGQHYDDNMSKVFFRDLELPEPDVYLGVGSGSHAEQTAKVMLAFESVVLEHRPDWVMVVGDVNSTLACALDCAKLGVRVAHVEAGLRSFDRTMPEEINRLLTDQVAELLFTPSRDGDANLLREGVAPEKIVFVGNVMIDSLVRLLPKTEGRPIFHRLGLETNWNRRASCQGYVLVTFHRPSNVDDPASLAGVMAALTEIARETTIVFPIHPRTRSRLADIGWRPTAEKLLLVEPLGYLDFLALERCASLVITDSGGVQEETTYLGVPCLTLRLNTERPVTISHGTNRLVASDRKSLVNAAVEALNRGGGGSANHGRPELWDGRAAQRIVEVLRQTG